MAANLYQSRFYQIWANMKQRCLNKNMLYYWNYGGRGIKVSDEWLQFEGFKKDMYKTYKNDLTIDRIDSNGNYCKENCRWATRTEQNNNARTNKIIEYRGIKRTFSQWVALLGLKGSTIRQRYYVYKWDIDKCFNYRRGGALP
mgnify:FL=1